MSRRAAHIGVVLSWAVAIPCGFKPVAAQGHHVPEAVSLEGCRDSSQDRDRDGLDDRCELALARAFAPLLVVDPRDCLIEGAGAARRLRGGYLFAAAPIDSGVRIAYLPAYTRDCGWSGVARALRLGRRNDHDGDSEFIVVDVAGIGPARWQSNDVFLSAHCGGRSDGRCRWFPAGDRREIAWFEHPRGAPIVWVARDKHANYPSHSSCESGHWGQEACAQQGISYRFPVSDRSNIGSRSHPLGTANGCVTAAAVGLKITSSSHDAVECLWSETAPFRGWQGNGKTARTTPYGRHLRTFGF